MEAKAYYGPDNRRVLATQMVDGSFQVIDVASMTMRTMTADELTEFKSGSAYRRYGNGEKARVLREFATDDAGEVAVWFSPINPGTLHRTPRAEWDDFVTEIRK